MAERRRIGLYFNYDEAFTRGHKCKQLSEITIVNDYDNNDDDADDNLMVLIDRRDSGIQGASQFYQRGMLNGGRSLHDH